jgi:hypothetical protein
MIRHLSILFLACSAAVGATNDITITDTSGSTQTNRPFSISRVFVQGAYPTGQAPQARVGGSTLLTTQVDVKTSYSDGSIKHAIVSFVVPTISANSSVTIDFPQQSTPSTTGFLDKAAMLAFNSNNWDASITAVNGTGAAACNAANGTCVINVRTLLTAWSGTDGGVNGTGPRYWLKGPIVTQFILEDISTTRADDFGFNANKPLHPQFILTFYPTSALTTSVRIDYMVEAANTEKLQDQTYALTLKSGVALSTVYTKASFTHAATTRWHKEFWSGTAPTGWTDELHPGVNINHNIAYWASTGAVPNYDTTVTVNSSSGYLSAFNATDKCDVMGFADYTQAMESSGGRLDIGVVTVWSARWLLSMDKDAWVVSYGHALCSFGVPMHYREAKAGKVFLNSASAIGWPASIESRPTILFSNLSFGGTDPADAITPVGATSTNGWSYEVGHTPNFAYVAYIFSGEYFFLEEMFFQAAADAGMNTPGDLYYQRGGGGVWGFFSSNSIQTRGQAWGRRSVAEAAYVAPDGSNVKAFYTNVTINNITIEEGAMNLTTSANFCTGSTSTCKWQWGRQVVSGIWGGATAPNPFFITVNGEDADDGPYFPTGCASVNRFWQWHYKYNVMGHIQDLGFPITLANSKNWSTLIHVVQDSGFNPYLLGGYSICTVASATGNPFTSFATLKSLYNTNLSGVNLQNVSTWWDPASGDTTGDGYPHIGQAALSYATNFTADGLSGQSAYDWTTTGCPGSCRISRAPFSDNPQWAVLPRAAGSPTAPTVSTTAASSITTTTASAGGNVTADGGASVTARGTCYATSSNPTTPCTSDGTGTGSFTSSLTSLITSTLYHIRAFATNSVGTSYGSDLTFTTSATATPSSGITGKTTIGGRVTIK